jgi:hypothetical protein
VAADDDRTPAPPEGSVLRSYARLLELIGDACHAERDRLVGTGEQARSADENEEALNEEAMWELHERLRKALREHAEQDLTRTVVLGTLLLQAENLWNEAVPGAGRS